MPEWAISISNVADKLNVLLLSNIHITSNMHMLNSAVRCYIISFLFTSPNTSRYPTQCY